jgi:tRNA G18 (ribose-2'-O)-methylase SpoU
VLIPVPDITDPRLNHYRGMKDRELARDGGRFLAESEFVVRRLLASKFPVESVISADRKAQSLAEVVPDHVPLYVLPERALNEMLGFKFHTGVMAVGIRLQSPPITELLPKPGQPGTIAVCPDLNNFENLGAIIRTAVGFGVDGILLGERSCDPFFRMCVRVSMGTIFKVPIVTSENLVDDLAALRSVHGYQLFATVLDTDAAGLPPVRPDRCGILFGNEAVGLSPEHVAACDQRITLPMKLGTDSLNVAVAAGIFLHHFCATGA